MAKTMNANNLVALLPSYKNRVDRITDGFEKPDELSKPNDFVDVITKARKTKSSFSKIQSPSDPTRIIHPTIYWCSKDLNTCHFRWPIISTSEYFKWRQYAKEKGEEFEPGKDNAIFWEAMEPFVGQRIDSESEGSLDEGSASEIDSSDSDSEGTNFAKRSSTKLTKAKKGKGMDKEGAQSERAGSKGKGTGTGTKVNVKDVGTGVVTRSMAKKAEEEAAAAKKAANTKKIQSSKALADKKKAENEGPKIKMGQLKKEKRGPGRPLGSKNKF